MKCITAGMLALLFFQSAPAPAQNVNERALVNYRQMLAGQKQFHDFNLQEREEILELDRLLHSRGGIKAGETKEQCKERLRSDAPSRLESALLDLKCSQRPGP